MIFPAAATWLWFVALAGRPGMQVVYAATKLAQFGFPVAFLLWRGHGPALRLWAGKTVPHASAPAGTGTARVRGRRRLGGKPAGLAFGCAAALAIWAFYAGVLRGSPLLGDAPAEVRTKIVQLGLGTPAGFLLLAAFYSIVHSGLEEYYWRGFVFGGLRRRIHPAAAVALSSLAFCAHHVIVLDVYFRHAPWLTVLGSAGVAVGGGVWAWLYERDGSLSPPWLSHFAVDAALMAIGYDMVWPIV